MKRVLGGSGICNGSQRRHGILTGDNGWEGASGGRKGTCKGGGRGKHRSHWGNTELSSLVETRGVVGSHRGAETG